MKRLALTLVLALTAQSPAQKIKTSLIPVEGSPSSIVTMPSNDGSYFLFLTVSNKSSSGIQVFHVTGSKIDRQGLIRLGSSPAQGLVLIPHTHTLAAGVTEDGVAFIDVDEAFKGHPHPIYLTQGPGSGAGYLAATPDGQYLFVANEYGANGQFGHGNIGVIALHPDAAGHITAPETLGHIPAPMTTPSLALSPAGDTLYAVSEVGPRLANNKFFGADNPVLAHEGCTQAGNGSKPNGLLYVIDVARATAMKPNDHDTDLAARRTIKRRLNAGCSPVRVAASGHGDFIYITARGDNKVLVFDARQFDMKPDQAFVRAIPTDGTAPVGLHLFADDTKLLVANSNRFDGGSGNAVILDLATGKIEQKLSTGKFPRNIGISPDGSVLYLSNYESGTLEVIPVAP